MLVLAVLIAWMCACAPVNAQAHKFGIGASWSVLFSGSSFTSIVLPFQISDEFKLTPLLSVRLNGLIYFVVNAITANLKFTPFEGSLSPYIMVGGGVIINLTSATSGSALFTPVLDGAVGIEWVFSDQNSIYLETRGVMILTPSIEYVLLFTVGFTFKIGDS